MNKESLSPIYKNVSSILSEEGVLSGLHSIWKCKLNDTSSNLDFEKLYERDKVSSSLYFQIECNSDDIPSNLYKFSNYKVSSDLQLISKSILN